MIKKFHLLVLVAVFATGCATVDPNEKAVPDGQDFRSSTMTPSGSNVTARVYFWDNGVVEPFRIYFSTDGNPPANVTFYCTQFSVQVQTDSLSPLTSASRSGTEYTFEFPKSALGVTPPAEVQYWVVKGTTQEPDHDRMPDTGTGTLRL